jgi:hypothetical protein
VTTERAPFEALDAYQSGDMADEDASAFEEELFASAAAGTAHEADFVDRVTRIGSYLSPRGGFDIGSSRTRVDQLIAMGLRVQLIEPAPAPVTYLPKVDDDAEIVVTHWPLDLRGYDSVDVVVEKPDGRYLKTFRDIGWDPIDGTIYAVCEATLARISFKQGAIRSRVVGYRGGEQHVIAEFDTIAS